MDLEEEVSLRPTVAYYRHNLCQTLGGNACPLITITGKPTGTRKGEQKEKEEAEGKVNLQGDLSLDLSIVVVSSSVIVLTEDEGDLVEKQYIVLTGRVHPGESNSSWTMKGESREL